MGVDRRDKLKRSDRDTCQTKNADDAGEYCDVIQDIRRLRSSWMTSSNPSDNWRRIETSGLENSLKVLSRIKSELFILISLSTEEARQLNILMDELTQLLTRLRLAFIDSEKEIFDDDELEKRYLTVTCPLIVEVWSAYSMFACETTRNVVQKLWQDSAYHKDLLQSLVNLGGASVKLLILTTDPTKYHSLQEVGSLQGVARHEAESACSNQERLVTCISEMSEKEVVMAPLQELSQWTLYGVWHLLDKVIKQDLDARAPDDGLSDYEELMKTTESMLQKLKSSRGGDTKEAEPAPVKEAPPEKKNSTTTKQEPADEKKELTKDGCLAMIQRVGGEYSISSEEACSKNRLPMWQCDSGIRLLYRMETYSQIGKLMAIPSPMERRKELLDSLGLSKSHKMSSDLYVLSPEPLTCSQEVTIQFPIKGGASTDDNSTLCLKLKREGNWEKVENPEQIQIDDTPYMVIKTNSCEAFTAVTYTAPDTCAVSPTGTKYDAPTNQKVELHFPEGCVDEDVTVKVKLLDFDKGEYEKQFVGVMSASVGVELIPDKEVTMKKRFSVQLPMVNDIDDKDTELVLARCQGDKVQILDKKQISLKQREPDVYSFEMTGFWSVAILRIRRVFLNMRESIKKEFKVGYGLSDLCSIITYIDHENREGERQVFVMEVVKKCDADSVSASNRAMGFVEVKNSRSKDILLNRGDQLVMLTDGQIRSTEQLTDNHNVLCYMHSGWNVISVATEIKRDPERLPDAMLLYKKYPDEEDASPVHSVSIMTRDLSELPTEEITARHLVQTHLNHAGKRHKQNEEAAIKILQMESLMSLAREMTFEEGRRLGRQMGVKPEVIQYIRDKTEGEDTSSNFQILCEWRGRSARAAMADFLVSSLRAVGNLKFAEIITNVRQKNRELQRTDFHETEKEP